MSCLPVANFAPGEVECDQVTTTLYSGSRQVLRLRLMHGPADPPKELRVVCDSKTAKSLTGSLYKVALLSEDLASAAKQIRWIFEA